MSEVKSKQFNHPILITGGAGFLGSHMVALCLEKKVDVVVIDNLTNSDLSNLQTLEKHFKVTIPFYEIDIRDQDKLNQFFKEHQFSAVIHFAGLKSVSESVANPDLYHDNNIMGSQNLIDCIKKVGIKNIIFSSSATVYGDPQYLPIDEDHPINPINPYGQSKAAVEQLFLNDKYFNTVSVKLLRYFNPVGSYKGIIGEKPNGVPNNLMPYILGVTRGEYDHLNIFGDDYETKDGTGVRDYIHVMDLIEAHWAALIDDTHGCNIYNVGSGRGLSVKELLTIFERVNNVTIPFKLKQKRAGDVPSCFTKSERIKNNLSWSPKKNINEMCKDSFDLIKLKKCKMCGSIKYRHLFFAESHGKHYEIMKCNDCDVVYMADNLTQADLDDYYQKQYDYDDFLHRQETNPLAEATVLKNLKLIKPYFKSHPKLLEVGCMHGYFLKKAREIGFDVTGLEKSKNAAIYGKKIFGLDIKDGDLSDAKFKANSFDIIFISHVIEHLPNPKKDLKVLKKILKPNGLLVILCPNFNSIGARVFNRTWSWLCPPEHIFQYTPATISALLNSSGFSIKKLTSTNGDQGYLRYFGVEIVNFLPFSDEFKVNYRILIDENPNHWSQRVLFRLHRLLLPVRWVLYYFNFGQELDVIAQKSTLDEK